MAVQSNSTQDQKEIVSALVAARKSAVPGIAATAGQLGEVLKANTVANATVATDATSVATQFNALLVSLKAAGIMS